MTTRVLIVSTVFHQARLLEKPLLDSEFAVVVATGEADGLALCHQGWADIVILEGLQPGLDGFAFCRGLKNDPALKHFPVGLITDAREPCQRFEALQARADECMLFPLAERQYLTCVRSLADLSSMTRRAHESQAVAGFGEQGLDAPAQILLLDPEPSSRERLEEILSAEFRMVVARRAEDAVACMAQEAFGIILADEAYLRGAGPMGSLLLQHLRIARLSRRIRLLGIGGVALDQTEGAIEGVLERPVDRSETLIRVRTALRKHSLDLALRKLRAPGKLAAHEPHFSGSPASIRMAA
jgi:DNA-binding response OmpR family regulator